MVKSSNNGLSFACESRLSLVCLLSASPDNDKIEWKFWVVPVFVGKGMMKTIARYTAPPRRAALWL